MLSIKFRNKYKMFDNGGGLPPRGSITDAYISLIWTERSLLKISASFHMRQNKFYKYASNGILTFKNESKRKWSRIQVVAIVGARTANLFHGLGNPQMFEIMQKYPMLVVYNLNEYKVWRVSSASNWVVKRGILELWNVVVHKYIITDCDAYGQRCIAAICQWADMFVACLQWLSA